MMKGKGKIKTMWGFFILLEGTVINSVFLIKSNEIRIYVLLSN